MNTDDVSHYIEIRGVYDGWSVAVMQDGTMRNRWEPGTPRYLATQEWIEANTNPCEISSKSVGGEDR